MTPPMRRKLLPCLLASLCAPSLAAEVTTLPVVEVSASAEDGWLKPERATPSTVYRVGGEALGAFGNPGGTNPYLNLADLPGVKITPVDAYGLNNMQGGQKGMRVRGEVSTHGVSGTVEGLALNGPGPGPGYLFLFDRENLASLTFAQGALAADQAGLFNSYGALDSQLLWPRREAGGELSFSMGSERFQRVFARADSGQLASGTAFFISASDTRANKWRGNGQAPGNRDNLEFGLSQALGPLNLKLWYARNEQSQHTYQALTYRQATNLDAYYRSDYPNNRNSAQHYDYNRQDFRNEALLAELDYTFSPTLSLSIKPFYSREQGYYLYAGSSDTQVLKWLIDHTTYGVNSELRGLWGDTEIKLGHSWTSTEPPGPPTTRTQYVIRNGSLQFDRWAMLSKTVDRHEFHSFYLSALHQAGPLTVQGGLRYARETLPSIDAYTVGANSAWDVSADQAYSLASRNAARSVSGRTLAYWLPQLGAAYQLTPQLQARASLGRTIGAPSFDAYNQAPSGAITTSQQYWDQLKPELGVKLDLGLRWQAERAYLEPTLYFSRSRNKGVNVYSEQTRTVYSQNIGQTRGYGLQLSAGLTPLTGLRLFGALSYSRSQFSEDVRTNNGAWLPVQGKQLPDVPRWMANLGAAWQWQGLTVAPSVNYVGSRWATSTYTERLPGYLTADLNFSYAGKARWGGWELGLSVLNVFDRRYIGQISTSEINTASNGAIYYPGAPRTVVGKVKLTF